MVVSTTQYRQQYYNQYPRQQQHDEAGQAQIIQRNHHPVQQYAASAPLSSQVQPQRSRIVAASALDNISGNSGHVTDSNHTTSTSTSTSTPTFGAWMALLGNNDATSTASKNISNNRSNSDFENNASADIKNKSNASIVANNNNNSSHSNQPYTSGSASPLQSHQSPYIENATWRNRRSNSPSVNNDNRYPLSPRWRAHRQQQRQQQQHHQELQEQQNRDTVAPVPSPALATKSPKRMCPSPSTRSTTLNSGSGLVTRTTQQQSVSTVSSSPPQQPNQQQQQRQQQQLQEHQRALSSSFHRILTAAAASATEGASVTDAAVIKERATTPSTSRASSGRPFQATTPSEAVEQRQDQHFKKQQQSSNVRNGELNGCGEDSVNSNSNPGINVGGFGQFWNAVQQTFGTTTTLQQTNQQHHPQRIVSPQNNQLQQQQQQKQRLEIPIKSSQSLSAAVLAAVHSKTTPTTPATSMTPSAKSVAAADSAISAKNNSIVSKGLWSALIPEFNILSDDDDKDDIVAQSPTRIAHHNRTHSGSNQRPTIPSNLPLQRTKQSFSKRKPNFRTFNSSDDDDEQREPPPPSHSFNADDEDMHHQRSQSQHRRSVSSSRQRSRSQSRSRQHPLDLSNNMQRSASRARSTASRPRSVSRPRSASRQRSASRGRKIIQPIQSNGSNGDGNASKGGDTSANFTINEMESLLSLFTCGTESTFVSDSLKKFDQHFERQVQKLDGEQYCTGFKIVVDAMPLQFGDDGNDETAYLHEGSPANYFCYKGNHEKEILSDNDDGSILSDQYDDFNDDDSGILVSKTTMSSDNDKRDIAANNIVIREGGVPFFRRRKSVAATKNNQLNGDSNKDVRHTSLIKIGNKNNGKDDKGKRTNIVRKIFSTTTVPGTADSLLTSKKEVRTYNNKKFIQGDTSNIQGVIGDVDNNNNDCNIDPTHKSTQSVDESLNTDGYYPCDRVRNSRNALPILAIEVDHDKDDKRGIKSPLTIGKKKNSSSNRRIVNRMSSLTESDSSQNQRAGSSDEVPLSELTRTKTVVPKSHPLESQSTLLISNQQSYNDYFSNATDESLSKTCIPPVLMQNYSKLKANLKFNNSSMSIAGSSTINALDLMAPSKTTDDTKTVTTGILPLHLGLERKRALPTNKVPAIARYMPQRAVTEYDHQSTTHAYVSYFRRGAKASVSVRLYENPRPPEFPSQQSSSAMVVVQIEASTVSTTDCAIRRGDYWNSLRLPIVPGVAFVGRVLQTKSRAKAPSLLLGSLGGGGSMFGLKEGDLVLSLVQVGANSRHLCIESDRLVKVTDDLHQIDLCAVPCLPEIYLTAFQALHLGQKNGARYRKKSLAGSTILILGGATALGHALIEIGLAAGCEKIYATAKDKQFDSIKEMGALPLGRDAKQWYSVLSKKIDVVIGIDHTYNTDVEASELKGEHFETVADDGRIIMLCGPENDHIHQEIDLDEIAALPERVGKGRKLLHYNVFDSWDRDLKQGKRDLTHLLKLLAGKMIRPKILEKIPLNRIAKAHDLMDSKRLNGFVICEPWAKCTNASVNQPPKHKSGNKSARL